MSDIFHVWYTSDNVSLAKLSTHVTSIINKQQVASLFYKQPYHYLTNQMSPDLSENSLTMAAPKLYKLEISPFDTYLSVFRAFQI